MELKKIKYEDVPNRALIVYFLECIKDYFYPNYFSKVDDVNGVLNRAKDLFRTYISSSREDEEYFFSHLDEVKDILSNPTTIHSFTYSHFFIEHQVLILFQQ